MKYHRMFQMVNQNMVMRSRFWEIRAAKKRRRMRNKTMERRMKQRKRKIRTRKEREILSKKLSKRLTR